MSVINDEFLLVMVAFILFSAFIFIKHFVIKKMFYGVAILLYGAFESNIELWWRVIILLVGIFYVFFGIAFFCQKKSKLSKDCD